MEQKMSEDKAEFAVLHLHSPSILDLITDPGTNQLSHTKIWTNIAYLVATIAFVKITFSSDEPDLTLWLLYLCVIGGHSSLSKLISLKYNKL